MLKSFFLTFFLSNIVLAQVDFNKPPTGEPGKLCYNGKIDFRGVCVCDVNYAGKLCERKKHCATFDRYANYSCIECQEGYVGTECDFILCKNGVPNNDKVTCKCEQPYTGKFCEELKTGDVYLYYNRAIYQWGPLGVISIIPLIMILFGCNALAKKHQQQKVEKALKEQFEVDVTSHMVKVLLKK